MVAGDAREIDEILAVQLLVAWAGEGRSEPKRFGWWETDLVDEAGGGDLLERLAPRTHAWAALELVREAARQVDARALRLLPESGKLRSLFCLGFEWDEKLNDRLAELKRQGQTPAQALPLAFSVSAVWDPAKVTPLLSRAADVAFDNVLPCGRQLKGGVPSSPLDMANRLATAMLPVTDEYPLPHFRVRN
jgi:hypothetical protein